jgi:hypothetical protein
MLCESCDNTVSEYAHPGGLLTTEQDAHDTEKLECIDVYIFWVA